MNMSKSATAIPNVTTAEVGNQRVGYSFYQKLFFLYFLNLIDWVCTEALLASGRFYEANPLMQGIMSDFWQTILIKGVLPLAVIIVCCIIFKLANVEENFFTKLIVYIGIIAYALVNLWHIFNFVLLFSTF